MRGGEAREHVGAEDWFFRYLQALMFWTQTKWMIHMTNMNDRAEPQLGTGHEHGCWPDGKPDGWEFWDDEHYPGTEWATMTEVPSTKTVTLDPTTSVERITSVVTVSVPESTVVVTETGDGATTTIRLEPITTMPTVLTITSFVDVVNATGTTFTTLYYY